MQIWTPRRLEGPQQSRDQPEEPSHFRKNSIAPSMAQSLAAPSTAQSLARSLTTSHTSHLSPLTEENAIAYSIEMPGQPILVSYLSADGEGGNEMSFLTIESKLRNDRSGEA